MCEGELFGFYFIVCLHNSCCFLRETNNTSQIVFVVTRTENRANNLVTEKTFALKALKIAIVLLKQPALLKLRALV